MSNNYALNFNRIDFVVIPSYTCCIKRLKFCCKSKYHFIAHVNDSQTQMQVAALTVIIVLLNPLPKLRRLMYKLSLFLICLPNI